MKTNQQIAAEELMGKWGNGEERKKRLREAGYDYSKIQSIVNALVSGDGQVEEQQPVFTITGNDTLKIEVDLTIYNSIELTFINGSEE